jgi:hypothetical protein
MMDKFEKESKEYLKYLEMNIQRALKVPSQYGKPLLSRIVPLLRYKEKLEEAIQIYHERHYPKQA